MTPMFKNVELFESPFPLMLGFDPSQSEKETWKNKYEISLNETCTMPSIKMKRHT